MTMETQHIRPETPRSSRRFALRAMTSVLIGCSSLVLLFSGVVLFLAPPGRIANWNGWNIAGIGKHDWSGLHVWFAVIFLVASVLHIYYNWRVLMAYFKHRHTRRVAFRLEWAVALLICVGVFAGTRAGIVPFSSLLQAGGCPGGDAGGGGGGRGCGQALSSTGGAQCGETAGGEASCDAAQPAGGRQGGGPGSGMGRRTLAEVCAAEKLDVQEALARLQKRGYKATAGQTLRDIAGANGLGRPGEIAAIVRGEEAPAH